jgi:putative transposase
MARPLRLERPGAWYHLTARGNERRAVYRDLRDRGHFCELLARAVSMYRWRLHAFVLMDNHYHLLVETLEANLTRSMQWLNLSYSVWFNRRHERSGHLFQGRYQAILVDPTAWGLEVSRYLHLNPVRVSRLGLDRTARQRDRAGASVAPGPAQVEERLAVLRRYRWSSYRAYVGLAPVPAWLTCASVLGLGGRPRNCTAREAYREYVEGALRQGLAARPWERLTARLALGSAEFLRDLRRVVQGDGREQPDMRRLRTRPALEQVIAVVAGLKGEPWPAFRDRYGDWGRDLVLYLGRTECSLQWKELGKAAGGIDYVSASTAVRRFEQRRLRVPELANLLRQAQRRLVESPNE